MTTLLWILGGTFAVGAVLAILIVGFLGLVWFVRMAGRG